MQWADWEVQEEQTGGGLPAAGQGIISGKGVQIKSKNNPFLPSNQQRTSRDRDRDWDWDRDQSRSRSFLVPMIVTGPGPVLILVPVPIPVS